MASKRIKMGIDVDANVSKAKAAFNELQASLQRVSTSAMTSKGTYKQTQQLQQASKAAQDLQGHLNAAYNMDTGQLQLDKFNLSLKASNQSVKGLSNDLLKGGEAGQKAFMNMAHQITNAQAPTQALGGMFNSLWTTMKSAAKWQFAYGAINAFTTSVRNAVQYMKELDTSLNKIRIVTGMSKDEMEGVAKSANKMAKDLSASTKEIVKGQLIYFQQGNSAELAAKKAEITTKATNIAFSASQAQMAEYLTAIWNSYQVGEDKLQSFVDKIAAVGANTATSMEELATAMQKVASTANAVGVTYDQLNATIATISSTTRLSADTVGTALKTIYARIADLKLGGEDEDGVGLGKVSGQLHQIGIEVLDETGELRDMGTVVEEIGEKWQTMSKAQQTATAEAIAGKRTYTQLVALFDNFDKYKDTLKISMGAEGELDKQQKIFSESWEAASKRVKASWEGLYDDLLNQDIFIKFTDTINVLVNGLDILTRGLGGIPGILMLITTHLLRIKGVQIHESVMNFGRWVKIAFGNTTAEVNEVRMALMELKNTSVFQQLTSENKAYFESLVEVNELEMVLNKNTKNMSQAQQQEINLRRKSIEVLQQQARAQKEVVEQAVRSAGGSRIDQDVNRKNIARLASKQMTKSNFQSYGDFNISGKQMNFANIMNPIPGYVNIQKQAYAELANTFNTTGTYGKQLKETLSLLELRYGNNKQEIQQLRQEMDNSAVSADTLEQAFQLLTHQGKNLALTDTVLQKDLTQLALDLGVTEERAQEIVTSFIEMRNSEDAAHEGMQKLIADANSMKGSVGLTQWISSITQGLMSMSMMSSAMDTLLADGEKTFNDLSSAAMSFGMAIASVVYAFKMGTPVGWISLILTVIGLLASLAQKFHWFESSEKRLNRQIDETKKKVDELNQKISEREGIIDDLREKQKKAHGAEAQELQREIDLNEKLNNIDKKSVENEEQNLRGYKSKKADQFFDKTAYYSESGVYRDVNEATGQKIVGEKSQIKINSTKGQAQTDATVGVDIGSVVRDYTKLIGYQKTINKLKDTEKLTDNELKDYEEAITESTRIEAQAVKDLTEAYALSNKPLEEKQRFAIGYLEKIYGITNLAKEDQRNQFLSGLFNVDPESFKSFETFWETWGAFLGDLGKEDAAAWFNEFGAAAKAAEKQIKKNKDALKDLKTGITGLSDALGAVKENKGWLSSEELQGFEKALEMSGEQVQAFEDEINAAQGDVSKMTALLQKQTQQWIANKIAMGEYDTASVEQIEAELRAANVTNAHTMALEIKAQAEEYAAAKTQLATYQNKELTKEEKESIETIEQAIGALTGEAGALSTVSAAAMNAYLQERVFANQSLDSTQKVAEIQKIAKAYLEAGGSAAWALQMMNAVNGVTQDNNSTLGRGQYGHGPTHSYKGKDGTKRTFSTRQEAIDAYLKEYGSVDVGEIKISAPSFSGGSSGGSGGGGGNEETAAEKAQKQVENLKKQYDLGLISLEEYYNGVEDIIKTGVFDDDWETLWDTRNEVFSSAQSELDTMFEKGLISAQQYHDKIEFFLQTAQLSWAELEEVHAKEREKYDIEANNIISDLDRDISHRASWGMIDREQDLADLAAEREIAWRRYEAWAETGDKKKADEWYDKAVELDNKRFDKLKEIHEKNMEDMKNFLEDMESGFYDWNGSNKGLELLKQYKEVLETEAYKNPEERAKAEREARKAVWDWAKSEIKFFYDKWKEEQNSITERIKAQKSIWSGYYETNNSLLEAQHEINKELQKSLTSMQYLDEDTRKLLFNTEDYAALSKEINKLQNQANRLRDDYLNKIEGKTKEEVSLITEEYERQNKLLQKQYEIAKKQLEVDKARMKLRNVLNERNTRMFIGGQWQWVADQEAIIEAQEALADAEYESNKSLLERQQQMYLNTFDESVANITSVLNKMEKDWKDLEEKMAGHATNLPTIFTTISTYSTELGRSLANVYSSITSGFSDTNVHDVVTNTWTPSTNKGVSFNPSTDYAQKALDAAAAGNVAGAYTALQQRIAKTGGVADANQASLTKEVANKLAQATLNKLIGKKASGTYDALPGLSYVNERGLELLGRNGQLIELQGGDKIFSNPQMDFLYRFSRNPASAVRNLAQSSGGTDNSITINGFTIDGNTPDGENLRSILMRVVGNR